ncbi:uncharacterized protein K02A2.6-like [Wyeomyia smithii]|uniref:uncharacterized protein K02A2.6-like n=1 Tax=Wyeomyia smithii TaxID=174621 RepID=UPI002467C713|nr:uncharacterized protein K02A2.6-like [Wyeomyia smithii]
MAGWPENRALVEPMIRKYWHFRDELAVYEGLIFKTNQVVNPHSMRRKMLAVIHSGHPGLQSGIRRAKQVMFWINMAKDIQDMTDACQICQKHMRSNVKHTIVSKEILLLPCDRVATDLFHFRGKEFILIVDSSYLDFKKLSDKSFRNIIQCLKEWFSVHGIPRVLESDNGPQFSSQEFRDFAKMWCFDHCTSSPIFPRANGLAERYVQTAKNILKKCAEDKSDVQLAMLHVRDTPRSEGLPASCERLMGRLLRSNLPIALEKLQPKTVTGVTEALDAERNLQKCHADRGATVPKHFQQGESVLLQQSDRTWKPATVVKSFDERSYAVDDGEKVLRRNAHHLRPTTVKNVAESEAVQRDEVMSTNYVRENLSVSQPTQPVSGSNDTTQQTTRSGRLVKPALRKDFVYY